MVSAVTKGSIQWEREANEANGGRTHQEESTRSHDSVGAKVLHYGEEVKVCVKRETKKRKLDTASIYLRKRVKERTEGSRDIRTHLKTDEYTSIECYTEGERERGEGERNGRRAVGRGEEEEKEKRERKSLAVNERIHHSEWETITLLLLFKVLHIT